MRKKLMAMLLCAAMLLTLVPTMAFAETDPEPAEPEVAFTYAPAQTLENTGIYLIVSRTVIEPAEAEVGDFIDVSDDATTWTLAEKEGAYTIKSNKYMAIDKGALKLDNENKATKWTVTNTSGAVTISWTGEVDLGKDKGKVNKTYYLTADGTLSETETTVSFYTPDGGNEPVLVESGVPTAAVYIGASGDPVVSAAGAEAKVGETVTAVIGLISVNGDKLATSSINYSATVKKAATIGDLAMTHDITQWDSSAQTPTGLTLKTITKDADYTEDTYWQFTSAPAIKAHLTATEEAYLEEIKEGHDTKKKDNVTYDLYGHREICDSKDELYLVRDVHGHPWDVDNGSIAPESGKTCKLDGHDINFAYKVTWEVTVPEDLEDIEVDWDGDPHDLPGAGLPDNDWYEITFEYNEPSQTAVGEYTATLSLKDPVNCVWAGAEEGEETEDITYTLTITPPKYDVTYYDELTAEGYTEDSEDERTGGTTVTLELNGGAYASTPTNWTATFPQPVGNDTYTKELTADLDIADDAFVPTQTGKVFVGWQVDATNSTDSNLILVAQWEDDVIGGDPGDDIPDKYQVTVTFEIVEGEWTDNTTEDKTVVLTLTKKVGTAPNVKTVWATDGSAALGSSIPTAKTKTGGVTGAWVGTAPTATTTVTADTTYTYSYKALVIYDANGGRINGDGLTNATSWSYEPAYNTPAEAILASDTSKIVSRSGYEFAGWYTDTELTKSWNFATPVTETVTLYAKWVDDLYDVIVTVVDSNEDPVTGATVTLKAGEDVKGETTTNASGACTLANVPAGNYTVAVVSGSRGATAAVSVVDDDVEITVKLPTEDITTKIEKKTPDTRDTSVKGLGELAEVPAYAPDGETEDHVEIIMDVEAVDAENAVPGTEPYYAFGTIDPLTGSQTVEYMDIDLSRVAYKGSVQVGDSVAIPDTTPTLMEVTVEFPTEGRDIYVYFFHDGDGDDVHDFGNNIQLRQLNDGETPVTGTYLVGHNCITFYSYYFSVYAIGWEPHSEPAPIHVHHKTQYKVHTPETVESGELTVSREWASSGMTVKITVTPDKGHTLTDLTVTKKNGTVIELTDKGDGVYTFTMPAADVWVNVSFECPRDKTCPIDPYFDTLNDHWWHDGIHYCLEEELMNGFPDGSFQPNGNTTRAQVTVMLWRMAGSPVVNYAHPFSDVRDDFWYTEAIRWAAAENVVKGISETEFAPNAPVTREQLAAMLYRYAVCEGQGFTGEWAFLLDFSDREKVSAWAYEAVCWCSMKGVVTGRTETEFVPSDNATRAEVAAMFQRFCEDALK